MPVFRTVHRLLLLLAALAIAGAAAESRTMPALDTVVSAVPAAATSAFESRDGPGQPAFFNAVRPPGLSSSGRVLENGPPAGGILPVYRLAVPYPPSPSLAPARLRALAHSRLEFAHASWIARSGALSSFGTSLPPPLLA
jgi:hypothetical protein